MLLRKPFMSSLFRQALGHFRMGGGGVKTTTRRVKEIADKYPCPERDSNSGCWLSSGL
jgi:hypothetical protein